MVRVPQFRIWAFVVATALAFAAGFRYPVPFGIVSLLLSTALTFQTLFNLWRTRRSESRHSPELRSHLLWALYYYGCAIVGAVLVLTMGPSR